MTNQTESQTQTQNYVALQPLNHNGTEHAVGDVLTLSDADALFLLKADYVRYATDEDGEPATLDAEHDNSAGDAELQKTLKQQADEIARLTAENEQLKQAQENPLPASPSEGEELKADYSKLTKAQLNAELDKREIEHDATAVNADLEALLVAHDAKQAATDSDAGGDAGGEA